MSRAIDARPVIKQINPDWRIVLDGDDFCLESNGPFNFDWWIEVAGPGSVEYCRYAYAVLADGESPKNYDEWLGEQP